jgi:hypothetical protein
MNRMDVGVYSFRDSTQRKSADIQKQRDNFGVGGLSFSPRRDKLASTIFAFASLFSFDEPRFNMFFAATFLANHYSSFLDSMCTTIRLFCQHTLYLIYGEFRKMFYVGSSYVRAVLPGYPQGIDRGDFL